MVDGAAGLPCAKEDAGFTLRIQPGSWSGIRSLPPSYRTRKWPSDNEALKQRISLMIWLSLNIGWATPPAGGHGRQPQQGEAAIWTRLTMSSV
ncbi:hypothetical protein [Salipiger pallidus]|uniref:hypothetical protein n=1 Tax=Salipiger pallidus TaxID=1775170 RepID=UPI003570F4E9